MFYPKDSPVIREMPGQGGCKAIFLSSQISQTLRKAVNVLRTDFSNEIGTSAGTVA